MLLPSILSLRGGYNKSTYTIISSDFNIIIFKFNIFKNQNFINISQRTLTVITP